MSLNENIYKIHWKCIIYIDNKSFSEDAIYPRYFTLYLNVKSKSMI